MEHEVGHVDDVRRDRCRVVQVDGRPVSVISAGESFYAVHDRCPHQPARISAGTVSGTFVASQPHELVYEPDQVIRCPWHGWEFDLETGRSLLEPKRYGLRTYEVLVRDDTVFVVT